MASPARSKPPRSSVLRWTLLSLAALAIILVPFFVYEEAITAWTRQVASDGRSRQAAAAVLGLLLASDVLLPIPSSLVSTLCGFTLGAAGGAAVSWAGMTAGALFGYWLGRRGARGLVRRLVGERELERASRAQERWGDWAIIVSRSVPVLAEASVVFAGVTAMPLGRFALSAGLANLAVSIAYATVGAYALEVDSFLLAFSGAVLLPGAALLLARRGSKSR